MSDGLFVRFFTDGFGGDFIYRCAVALIVTEKASGNSGGIGGFDYSGLVVIAGVIIWAFFCGGYILLAFVLSLLTRQNKSFRVLLVGISFLIGIIIYALFLR